MGFMTILPKTRQSSAPRLGGCSDFDLRGCRPFAALEASDKRPIEQPPNMPRKPPIEEPDTPPEPPPGRDLPPKGDPIPTPTPVEEPPPEDPNVDPPEPPVRKVTP